MAARTPEGRNAYGIHPLQGLRQNIRLSQGGLLPKCGAYNRPPRQEWVDAEGTVHYAGQEKECYEEKVCYEEQTRRPKPYIRQHVPKKGIIGAVIAVIIVIMAINLPRYIFGSIFGGKEELTPDYPGYDWSSEESAEEIEATVREYAEIGESFYLEDSAFAVASLKADWEEDILTVYVVEGDTYQTFPYLVMVGDDGFEDWNYPYDVSAAVDEHVFVCTYDLSVLEDLTGDTSLIFSGFDKEVAVPVDLAQW